MTIPVLLAALPMCSSEVGDGPGAGGSDAGGSAGAGATAGTPSSGGASGASAGSGTGATGGSANGGSGVGGAAGAGPTGGLAGLGGSGVSGAAGSSNGGAGADSGGAAGAAGTAGAGAGAGGAGSGAGGAAGAGAGGVSGAAGSSAGSGGSGGGGPTPDPGQPIGFASLNGGTTGGKGGQVVTVTSYADLKSYAESTTPYVIRVQGTISNGSGGGSISVQSNKTLVGVGSTGFLSGIGLTINNRNNVIVQNLRISLVGTTTPNSVNGGDVISIAGTSKNVWVDHCELFSEDPSVQTNIDKYDGLIDIRGQTGFITVSYSYLHDHHKGGLVGSADDDLFADRKVTFHHNYYDNVRLRIPMYRGSVGHFFNNYILGANDATEIRAGTCVRVEKNYYEPLHYSIYTPSDSPGSTERIDNIEVMRTSRAYPANCTADIPYSYSSVLINNTADVKALVPQGAGVGKI